MKGRALLSWNLRRIRSEQGISQEQLAYDSGVDRAYLSALERSQGNPTVDLIDRLAGVLRVDLGELFVKPRAGAKAPRPLKSGRPTSLKTNSKA